QRVESRYPEHLSGAFAVACRYDRGMDKQKAAFVKKTVDSVGKRRAEPENGPEGVGAGAQMGDGPEVLEGVALFLKGITFIGSTYNLDFFGGKFYGLPLCRRFPQ